MKLKETNKERDTKFRRLLHLEIGETVWSRIRKLELQTEIRDKENKLIL